MSCLTLGAALAGVPMVTAGPAPGSARGRAPEPPHRPAHARTISAAFHEPVRLEGLDPRISRLALDAAACAVAAGLVARPATLTVIDYSKPSTEERLWVFDLATGEALYKELVAHGRETGEKLATRFSNDLDSHQSSLGLFLTEDTYTGRNGYSLRLRGLEPGTNDRAFERAIVMHGAPYVSAQFSASTGRLGRSLGCPALSDAVARRVIDEIKGGGLLFSYYPDQDWLDHSPFLGQCRAATTVAN